MNSFNVAKSQQKRRTKENDFEVENVSSWMLNQNLMIVCKIRMQIHTVMALYQLCLSQSLRIYVMYNPKELSSLTSYKHNNNRYFGP